jgi:hypothetical protein
MCADRRHRTVLRRRYVDLLTGVVDAVSRAAPGDAPLLAVGDPERYLAMLRAAKLLGKSRRDVLSDVRVLLEAGGHRRRIAEACRCESLTAACFRFLRNSCVNKAQIPSLLREYRQKLQRAGHYAVLADLRRMAETSRRELSKLTAEHPELVGGERKGSKA